MLCPCPQCMKGRQASRLQLLLLLPMGAALAQLAAGWGLHLEPAVAMLLTFRLVVSV